MDAADRISQLPEHLIHRILSFLSTPEVVRLSVLSKPWHQVFTSFPISEFSSSSFSSNNSDRSFEFCTFVYNSLLRQCRQYRCIPRFQLFVSSDLCRSHRYSVHRPLPPQTDELISRCIEQVTQKGVEELSICFRTPVYYRLPEAMLSVTELAVCKLAGCLLEGNINWPSLRVLSLKRVEICDRMIIDNLLFACPFIEELALIECNGIDYLHLSGLRKLMKVKVKGHFFSPIKKIEIDVVSLHTFSYSACYYAKTDIDLASCKYLEVFKFKYCIITEDLVQHLNCNFPALKVLVLHGYIHDIQRFEISIPLLEKLKLSAPNLSAEEAIINAPRLRSFKCYMENIPPLFYLNQTSLQEVTLKLSVDLIYGQHGESFLEYFRENLEKINQIKLVTLLITNNSSTIINKIVRKVSNPVLLGIRNLKLNTYIEGMRKEGLALVDDLFCICRPESLLLESGSGSNDEFMKILCKKLVERVKHINYSADTHVKCWQRDLKGVKIEHFGRNGYWEAVTCQAFLNSFQNLESEKKIRFVFEW
ncbi:hypothetical protein SADUNF_Sadunf17G0132300 [Salix dunnii]|uniref:F-box domain-containing protein n=1 Tax=Salix dunnii TaxID=1413687 RepID=A0A835J8Y7_9ROSI|nr:hypothetical protein SADUNF_Sadunf17G0132300 [Salix dunnii]